MNKIFSNLFGKWIVLRKINNLLINNKFICDNEQLNSKELYYEGTADFDLIKLNSFLYREDLKINYVNNKTYNVFKEYIYTYDNKKISKYFTDNKLFYHLEFTNIKKANAIHYCNDDTYLAEYNFINQNNFILEYKIQGPNKDYIINTKYIRTTS